jgi:transposase
MGVGRAVIPRQARRTSEKRRCRKVLNAIFYVLSTGCQALPKDLPRY